MYVRVAPLLFGLRLYQHTPFPMASLGFNVSRQPRFTNLPGGVGANILNASARRRSPKRSVASVTVSASVTTTTPRRKSLVWSSETQETKTAIVAAEPQAPPASPMPLPSSSSMPSADAKMQSLYDSAQWVFADVVKPLVNSDGKQIEIEGATRVLLQYPMETDPDSGKVTMGLKTVNFSTGQLALTSIVVYDPEDDTRYVNNFSLVA